MKEIAKTDDIYINDRTTIGNVLGLLSEQHILSSWERSVILELTHLLNKAVHGASVDKNSAEWAISIGPKILEALDEKMNKIALVPNDNPRISDFSVTE